MEKRVKNCKRMGNFVAGAKGLTTVSASVWVIVKKDFGIGSGCETIGKMNKGKSV